MSESVISIWPRARVGTLWTYKRYKPIHPVRNPARPDRERGRHSATGQFGGSFMTAAPKNGPRIYFVCTVALIWRNSANEINPGTMFRSSEENKSELKSLMRISYAVFCQKKKKQNKTIQ